MKPFEYAALADVEDRHWWFRLLREEIIAAIDAHFGDRRNLRMLDAGCGTGGLIAHLLKHGPVERAVGIDYNPLALHYAQHKCTAHLVRADATQLPFADGVFDLITSIDVLYAREAYVNFDRALGEVRRCLRPGGLFILQLPAYQWMRSQHDTNVHTAHRFVLAEVHARLLEAGFAAPSVFYRYSLLLPLALVARHLRKGQADRSEVQALPGWSDTIFYRVARVEQYLGRWRLPFGLSVFAVVAKAREP